MKESNLLVTMGRNHRSSIAGNCGVTCKSWDRKIHDVMHSENGKLIIELGDSAMDEST
jgi:hypothetical protein